MNKTVAELQGLHSNAGNFISAEVDPRTGQFTAAVNFPIGAANTLKGPAPAMTLVYEPLQPSDNGFGMGWHLLLTQWNNSTRILTLASGESFKGQPGEVGQEFGFVDRKLLSFRVFNEGARLAVRHKSGLVEYLARVEGDRYLPVAMRSPEGHRVAFTYTEGGNRKLATITDDEHRVLMAIRYGSQGAEVQLYPEDNTREAPLTMTFILHQGRLQHVYLPYSATPSFFFDYYADNPSGLALLRLVKSPAGGEQWVEYKYDALPMPPGAPVSHMPAVKTYYQLPYRGQPSNIIRYLYSSNNAYGHNAVAQWSELEDNLYKVLHRYTYTSTEIHYVGGGSTEVSWTRREFNRFHLLELERTHQNGHWHETRTQYYDKPSGHFAEQDAYFQLPRTVTTRIWQGTAEVAERQHERIEACRYDPSGNLVWQSRANGSVEEHDYYPSSGELEGCPPDPLGFVRFIKQSRTTTVDGLVRLSRYTYTVLPAADGLALHHIVPRTMSALQVEDGVEIELELTQQSFTHGGVHHGRLASSTSVLNGHATVTSHHYVLQGSTAQRLLLRAYPTLLTTTTVTGCDGVSHASQEARSLVNGEKMLVAEPGRATVVYDYDMLGRLVTETRAPGTAYEATDHYAHLVSWDYCLQTLTTASGQVSTLAFDGLMRPVRRQQSDRNGVLYTAWETDYNELGQVVESRVYEPQVPMADGTVRDLMHASRYRYDDWGSLVQTTRPDGLVEFTVDDPIALTQGRWLQAQAQVANHTLTQFDLQGQPLEVVHWHGRTPRVVVQREYDGWGRVLRTVDAEGNSTRHRYDGFDREVARQLPDGTWVQQAYAPHASAVLPTLIRVQHPSLGAEAVVLGLQAFDGLGRVTEQTVAGRITGYEYTPGNTLPSRQHTAGNNLLEYRYEPALDGALLGYSTQPVTAAREGEDITYRYHPLLRQPVELANALGVQRFNYHPLGGQVESESLVYDQVEHTRAFQYSIAGRPVGHTGFDGSAHALRYDDRGRLASHASTEVTITYAYDAFGRIAYTHTQAGGRSMALSLVYDAMGRETQRVLESRPRDDAPPDTQVISQLYTAASKLMSRSWTLNGAPVRDDHYLYDVRGRLIQHDTEGLEGPSDAQGLRFTRQRFTFDALDNIIELETQLLDGRHNHSTFHYNPADATQLLGVRHSLAEPGYEDVDLAYDSAGHLTHDERGRPLAYDAQGRLVGVGMGPEQQRRYRYDPAQAVGAVVDGDSTVYRLYQGAQVCDEVSASGGDSVHYSRANGQVVAQSQLAQAVRSTIVLGGDSQGSVGSEVGEQLLRTDYAAYGQQVPGPQQSNIGYSGERREEALGWYLLGSARAFNPVLMRFHSPDLLSPFGAGGLNAYAYCAGDPVNRIDPNGTAWWNWVIAGVGMAIGAAMTVATAGAAATLLVPIMAGTTALTAGAALTVGAATLGSVSMWTGGAAFALEDLKVDEKAGHILGYVSLGLGLASIGAEVGAAVAKKAAEKAAKLVAQQNTLQLEVINEANGIHFTDNLFGDGHLAYITHGSPDGDLLGAEGARYRAAFVARRDIAPRINALNPPPEASKPLTLVCCYALESGTGQAVADVLNRPVIAFAGAPFYDPKYAGYPLGYRFTGKYNIEYVNDFNVADTPEQWAARWKAVQSGAPQPPWTNAVAKKLMPSGWA